MELDTSGQFEFWPFQTGQTGAGTALPFVLIPIGDVLKERPKQAAMSGTELVAWVNGRFRLPTQTEARAFSEYFSKRLGDRQVVFPLADTEALLVRLPRYKTKRLSDDSVPSESDCRPAPLHYVFTDASWVALIRKK